MTEDRRFFTRTGLSCRILGAQTLLKLAQRWSLPSGASADSGRTHVYDNGR